MVIEQDFLFEGILVRREGAIWGNFHVYPPIVHEKISKRANYLEITHVIGLAIANYDDLLRIVNFQIWKAF